MTFGGPPQAFGLPPAKRDLGTISDDLYLELIRLVTAQGKRIEALEKHVGLVKEPVLPCSHCNVLGTHQPWCTNDAQRA